MMAMVDTILCQMHKANGRSMPHRHPATPPRTAGSELEVVRDLRMASIPQTSVVIRVPKLQQPLLLLAGFACQQPADARRAAAHVIRVPKGDDAVPVSSAPALPVPEAEFSATPVLAVGLERKQVSIVTSNVCAYHKHLVDFERDVIPCSIVPFHAHFVDTLLAASKPKGAVDAIFGDRGRITFNATRPCGGYRNAAAHAALSASSVRAADGGLASRPVGRLAECAKTVGMEI
eukprot:gene16723-biopygen7611